MSPFHALRLLALLARPGPATLFSAPISPVAAILRTRPAVRDVTPSLRRALWFLGPSSGYGFRTPGASTHPAADAAADPASAAPFRRCRETLFRHQVRVRDLGSGEGGVRTAEPRKRRLPSSGLAGLRSSERSQGTAWLAAPPRPCAGSSPARPAAPLRSRLGRSPGVSQSAAVCTPSPPSSPLVSHPLHSVCPYAGWVPSVT